MTGVDTDLATLREELTRFLVERRGKYPQRDSLDALARLEAELSRLREQRDEAPSELARLQQALVGVASGRCIHSPLITSASPLSRSGNFYSTLPEECPRCIAREALAGLDTPQKCESCARLQQALPLLADMAAELAKYASYDREYINKPMAEHLLSRYEALAGPGSEQSSLTESGSAGLPDTPADSQEDTKPCPTPRCKAKANDPWLKHSNGCMRYMDGKDDHP